MFCLSILNSSFASPLQFGPVEGALFPDYESDLRSGPMVPDDIPANFRARNLRASANFRAGNLRASTNFIPVKSFHVGELISVTRGLRLLVVRRAKRDNPRAVVDVVVPKHRLRVVVDVKDHQCNNIIHHSSKEVVMVQGNKVEEVGDLLNLNRGGEEDTVVALREDLSKEAEEDMLVALKAVPLFNLNKGAEKDTLAVLKDMVGTAHKVEWQHHLNLELFLLDIKSKILGTILSPQDTETWDGIDSSQWLAFRCVTGLIVDGYMEHEVTS
ncbi:hypothetical protein IFM89_029889 [Coptis chinensis]|uniref:Uncharacterized protein n=1 Tax=Coptis chinensis TaxID=261450 RepID=A0A835HHV8_9MAGN|nr:hypothetical protein IFM89_029889 [Coptis chinensis]